MISVSNVILNIKIMHNNSDASLNLLNENALNEAFRVDTFVHQKFINTNDVKPINSQPKKKLIKLLVETRKIILKTKKFR